MNKEIHPCKTEGCNYSSMIYFQRWFSQIAVEVRTLMSNYISYIVMDVITYPWPNSSECILVKWAIGTFLIKINQYWVRLLWTGNNSLSTPVRTQLAHVCHQIELIIRALRYFLFEPMWIILRISGHDTQQGELGYIFWCMVVVRAHRNYCPITPYMPHPSGLCPNFVTITFIFTGNPLNTWRSNNVVITSKRRHFDVITSKWSRFDVITTLLLRNVFAGKVWSLHSMERFSALLTLCEENSLVTKGQYRGALMFSLLFDWKKKAVEQSSFR